MVRLTKIVVRVMSQAAIDREILSVPGPNHPRKILYLTPKQFAQVFTEKRLELLEVIREHPDWGPSQLARHLNRQQEAISRDVGFFRLYGIAQSRETLETSEKPTRAPLARHAKPTQPFPLTLTWNAPTHA